MPKDATFAFLKFIFLSLSCQFSIRHFLLLFLFFFFCFVWFVRNSFYSSSLSIDFWFIASNRIWCRICYRWFIRPCSGAWGTRWTTSAPWPPRPLKWSWMSFFERCRLRWCLLFRKISLNFLVKILCIVFNILVICASYRCRMCWRSYGMACWNLTTWPRGPTASWVSSPPSSPNPRRDIFSFRRHSSTNSCRVYGRFWTTPRSGFAFPSCR